MSVKKIKIKKASEKEINFIYKLRNQTDVRKNSLNKNKISLKNHKKWFFSNTNSKNSKIYVILYKKYLSGYIRWKLINKFKYLSWAVDKKFRGNNITLYTLKLITKNEKNKFRAKILINNINSHKIALKADFKKKNLFKKYILFQK